MKSTMDNQKAITSAHVLIFPLPIQSPVKSMLKLAEILCVDEAIKVTFLTTPHIHQRLINCNNTQNPLAKYSNFRFEMIPDGLAEDDPRTVDQLSDLLQSIDAVAGPVFEEIIMSGMISCIITEALINFPAIIAKKNKVPLLCFDTLSPCSILTHMSLPQLIQAGDLPFKDDNLDEIIRNGPPGMEGILRRRDLPSFCRSHDIYNNPVAKLIFKQINNIPQAQALILNTFHALDSPILSQMLKFNPNIYAIGPLQAHHKTRLVAQVDEAINSNNLWKEDRSCISWLNQQPSKSVIFVSIGSLSVMTNDQFFEIWHGLVNSGSRFVWAQRPGSVIELDLESDQVPLELLKGTKERGCIVGWAPQEEALAHPSVGGFFTHCGWSSTLESIVEGKPMICWPYFIDQQVNSRYVEQVWRIGLDMKDMCDRGTIEKMIREIMGLKNDEFFRRAEEMSALAKLSVSRGGSSFSDLDRLVQDIKMMKIHIE